MENELKKQYREETGFDVYTENMEGGYTDEYVKWLQDKIIELQKLVKLKKR